MLASATEIVCELGLEDRLVAISHECDHPPGVLDRPRVSRPRFDPAGLEGGEIDAAVRRAMADYGSVYEVDADSLAELEPDLVLTQAVCEVCAVPAPGVLEILRQRRIDADVVSLDAHTLDEIFATIADVAVAAGVAGRAGALIARLRERLRAVEDGVTGAARPRVAALEWLDPPFSPGHWVPEMVALAGGTNLLGETGAPSRELEWEPLRALDPDVLLLMPCGFGVQASRREGDRQRARLETIGGRAIREGRAWVVDGSSYFNRSGPRVVTGVEILAGLFHPDRVPPPDRSRAAPWPEDER